MTDHTGCLTAADILAQVPGVTYRQLGTWTAAGYVGCHHHPGDRWTRRWTPDTVMVLTVVVAILTKFETTPRVAFAAATTPGHPLRHALARAR